MSGKLTNRLSIVIIHGLHGHPFKTWTSLKVQHSSTTPSPLSLAISSGAQYSFHSGKSIVRRTLSKFSQKWSKRTSSSTNTEQGTSTPTARGGVGSATVFWPADLLPIECPNARILMYGYNSKITRYMRGATAKNSLLSHGKDLLFSLCRERTRNCPLIFIGHSLGGIIVKEVGPISPLHDKTPSQLKRRHWQDRQHQLIPTLRILSNLPEQLYFLVRRTVVALNLRRWVNIYERSSALYV